MRDRMRDRRSRVRQVVLGVVLGGLLLGWTPPPAKAQWGVVHDPITLAAHVETWLEEVNRWLDTVEHYANMYENAVRQLTTLRGVLDLAEKQLVHTRAALTAMASIGRVIRETLLLRAKFEAMVWSQIRAIRSIYERAWNGILDPEANLRDMEEYLKFSIGKRSEQTLADLNRLMQMDPTLQRLFEEQNRCWARAAALNQKVKQALATLTAEYAKPITEQCKECIADLSRQIDHDLSEIREVEQEISRLTGLIEDRYKQYTLTIQDRFTVGSDVDSTLQGWDKYLEVKEDLEMYLNGWYRERITKRQPFTADDVPFLQW